MASLVDTNILVYRIDARFPEKQCTAVNLLREGLKEDSVRIPHQALVEFMAVTTRVRVGSSTLLSSDDARREPEELLNRSPCFIPMSHCSGRPYGALRRINSHGSTLTFGPMPNTTDSMN